MTNCYAQNGIITDFWNLKKRRQSYLPVCGTARSAYYATIKDLFDRFHNKPSNKKYVTNLRQTCFNPEVLSTKYDSYYMK